MMDNTYDPGDVTPPKLSDKHGGGGVRGRDDGELPGYTSIEQDRSLNPANAADDVFGSEESHDIKYKTLSWPMVAMLMITEIVSNGTLSLPSSLAAVGMVPGVIVILVLGIFATYTAWALVQFKLRHPEVHNMGDAGYILFGPIGREILGAGTVIFAIFGAGSTMLTGQQALSTLSDSKLCLLLYTGIIAATTMVVSFPRTLDRLSWLGAAGAACILVAAIVGMAGAGAAPQALGQISVAVGSDFVTAFSSITNPVFAFAGHFMFFVLISEMRDPRDAMKAAWTLQIFCTTLYIVFAVVTYWYLGSGVQSPSFLSLSPIWSKVAFGFALPNFLVAGALYCHTAAKLLFMRIFRRSRHLHSHTALGWGAWAGLILLANGAAFVLAVGVPIFNYVVGLTASLFAAWYTYGLAGAFWLHDSYQDRGGLAAWRRSWPMAALNFFTLLAGLFICVAGLYTTIVGIVNAYATGEVSQPFAC